MDMADLNLTPPQEEDGLPQNQEEDHQEGDAAGEGMFLDFNFSPPRDHEEAIREEVSIPKEAAIPEEEAIAQEGAIRRSAVNLTNEQRFGVYFALRVIKSRDGDICPDDKLLVATLLNTIVRTVERIWSDANRQIAEGLQVDVSNKKKGRSGRKRKDLDLSRTSTIPLNKRRMIRALARSLSVPRSTLHRRFQMDELKRVTNTVKPTLKPENKSRRLKICISMLDELWISTSRPLFKPMTNIVHIDEKWYDMTRAKNTYYLLPGEPPPVRTVPNTNSIGKVMFLTAVAKPRYNDDGEVTFNGKIGTWAFVEETEAVRKSQNRAKGTKELKSVKMTRNVSRDYLINKVIPAIQDKWPDEDEGATIFIQLDNAKPHVLPNDVSFREAVEQTDLDIRLVQQPPNSPDFNVLDLCFHNSLQSLTDCRSPKNIRELVEGVAEEFENYEVDKLFRSFVTLQAVMVEVMKNKGGNNYNLPHLHKDRRQNEGRPIIFLS
ncbi:hypothetical protein D1007_52324 [Hordeum vulgare]|nr:hypothetical protein D1007_52324 [Hordeum vulgare]